MKRVNACENLHLTGQYECDQESGANYYFNMHIATQYLQEVIQFLKEDKIHLAFKTLDKLNINNPIIPLDTLKFIEEIKKLFPKNKNDKCKHKDKIIELLTKFIYLI